MRQLPRDPSQLQHCNALQGPPVCDGFWPTPTLLPGDVRPPGLPCPCVAPACTDTPARARVPARRSTPGATRQRPKPAARAPVPPPLCSQHLPVVQLPRARVAGGHLLAHPQRARELRRDLGPGASLLVLAADVLPAGATRNVWLRRDRAGALRTVLRSHLNIDSNLARGMPVAPTGTVTPLTLACAVCTVRPMRNRRVMHTDSEQADSPVTESFSPPTQPPVHLFFRGQASGPGSLSLSLAPALTVAHTCPARVRPYTPLQYTVQLWVLRPGEQPGTHRTRRPTLRQTHDTGPHALTLVSSPWSEP